MAGAAQLSISGYRRIGGSACGPNSSVPGAARHQDRPDGYIGGRACIEYWRHRSYREHAGVCEGARSRGGELASLTEGKSIRGCPRDVSWNAPSVLCSPGAASHNGAYVASRAAIGEKPYGNLSARRRLANSRAPPGELAPRAAGSGDVGNGVVGQDGLGLPWWLRILRMTAASSMRAITRMGPLHLGHSSGSTS